MDESAVNTVTVVLRDYDPETDNAMIYSTWRNSAYYSAAIQPEKDNDVYFRQLTLKIAHILKRGSVRIACLEDCPIVIIGYSVFTGPHLDWIYVKPDWRHKGIATLLMPKNIETVTSDLTKTGVVICSKKKLTVKGD